MQQIYSIVTSTSLKMYLLLQKKWIHERKASMHSTLVHKMHASTSILMHDMSKRDNEYWTSKFFIFFLVVLFIMTLSMFCWTEEFFSEYVSRWNPTWDKGLLVWIWDTKQGGTLLFAAFFSLKPSQHRLHVELVICSCCKVFDPLIGGCSETEKAET